MMIKSRSEWEGHVKRILKSELKRKGLSYHDLAVLLKEIGVRESEPNIRNKMSRGKFSAVFMIQCLEAIGTSQMRID